MRKIGVALALALAGCAPLTEPSTASTSLPSVPGEAIATTSSLPSPMPGAAGIGDRLYPWLGNGGYDVEAYDIRLFFDPDTGESGWATGSVEITAVALQDLTQFNLDFVGHTVTEVVGLQGIAQTALPYRREGRELTIDPDGYIPSGTRFVISVSWEGSPGPVPQQAAPFQPGWQRGPDSYYAFSQPDGAAGWFPGNDHPRDRADVLLQVEVPAAYQAVGTGTLETSENGDGRRLWRFMLANVAPYQIPLAVGHFEQRTSVEAARTYLLWFDPDLQDDPRLEIFGLQAEITDFFESWFGPYPYQTVGALVVEDDVPAALETIEIATYTSLSLQAGHEIVAHEISHQWFGNWITLDQWEDIWLNEGLATFAQWLWLERYEGKAAYDRAVESAYRRMSGLDLIDEGMTEAEARQRTMEAFPPPSRPRADSLFNPSVYLRGGLAFVALRDAVGDEALKAFLDEYVYRFGGRGVTEEALLGLVTEHFGDEAAELLTAWSADPQMPPFRGLAAP